MHTLQICSWTWKSILKLRDKAKLYINYIVGGGKKISLWYDKWHPLSFIVDRYGKHIIYDFELGVMTKVEDII